MGMNTYWRAIFFNDGIQFGAACLAIVILMVAFRIPAFMYGGAILCVFLLLLFYIPVTLFLAYCLSFLCDTVQGASQLLPNLFFFVSVILSNP